MIDPNCSAAICIFLSIKFMMSLRYEKRNNETSTNSLCTLVMVLSFYPKQSIPILLIIHLEANTLPILKKRSFNEMPLQVIDLR